MPGNPFLGNYSDWNGDSAAVRCLVSGHARDCGQWRQRSRKIETRWKSRTAGNQVISSHVGGWTEEETKAEGGGYHHPLPREVNPEGIVDGGYLPEERARAPSSYPRRATPLQRTSLAGLCSGVESVNDSAKGGMTRIQTNTTTTDSVNRWRHPRRNGTNVT